MNRKPPKGTPRKAKRQDQRQFIAIADLARVIAFGYPTTATRLQKHIASFQAFHRHDEVAASESHRFAEKDAQICFEWRSKLSELAKQVMIRLPEFDGKLAHVGMAPDMWERLPMEQWEPLLEELRRVEAAAIRAANDIGADEAPTKTRGPKRISTEELSRRVLDARTMGRKKYCEEKRCTNGSITRWRKQLMQRGIDPDTLN